MAYFSVLMSKIPALVEVIRLKVEFFWKRPLCADTFDP